MDAPTNESVVANGLAFLDAAVDAMPQDDVQSQSFAALHLWTAIEVLVKARLAAEHWTLVLDKPDQASRAKFKSGDFRSVGGRQALERLQKLCGVEVSTADMDNVSAVESLRNRVAHFSLQGVEPAAVAAGLARGLLFLLRFLESEVEPNLDRSLRLLSESTRKAVVERLHEIEEVVRLRMAALEPELSAHGLCIPCPRCGQVAVVVDGGGRCLFCDATFDGADLAQQHLESSGWSYYVTIKDGGDWPVRTCPECDLPTLVPIQSGPRAGDDGCLNCGTVWGAGVLQACARCGEPMVPDEDESLLCSSCWGNLAAD